MRTIPLSEILVVNSTYKGTDALRKRLIAEGYKPCCCEACGLAEWCGNPIKLELHHKNGDRTDNRIENLAVLCPNCHAYTDTYRGKNKMSASSERKMVECRKVGETLTDNADGNPEPSCSDTEGVETGHDRPKTEESRSRYSPDHKRKRIIRRNWLRKQ